MIWSKECIRADGDIYAFIKIQNEFTGSITKVLRELHIDGNRYYVTADGNRVDVTNEREQLLRQESYIKEAMNFYKEYRR